MTDPTPRQAYLLRVRAGLIADRNRAGSPEEAAATDADLFANSHDLMLAAWRGPEARQLESA